MACTLHPIYTGQRRPRTDCKSCWVTYYERKDKQKEEVKEASTVIETNTEVKTDKIRKKVRTLKAKPVLEVEVVASKVESIVIPEVKYENISQEVNIPKSIIKEIRNHVESTINDLFDEILEKKMGYGKQLLFKEFDIAVEHLFLPDSLYCETLVKNLEIEGWGLCFYSYPLAKHGMIPGNKEHFTFKRVKRPNSEPIPDFTDPNTVKKYKKEIKKNAN